MEIPEGIPGVRRVAFLACLWFMAAVAFAAETNITPKLAPLLEGPDGKQIISERQWLDEAARLRRQWEEFLGPIPKARRRPMPAILATEYLPEFTRLRVSYEAESGVETDGYLLEPAASPGVKTNRPAIVVFHPTTPLQAKGVAGLAPEYPADKRQGPQLARLGYVVWCPRNFINAGDQPWPTNASSVLARHPNWKGMTRMVLDAMRAADFLEQWPGVDPRRIGCLGHSLGAKQALYAMAFDPRYKAGVFSEGGIGLAFSNWDAPWYLGPQIPRGFEHHQLLALIAPRAFLLIGGGAADGDPSAAFVESARPVHALFGAEDRLQFLNHRQGHTYPAEARDAAEKFFREFL